MKKVLIFLVLISLLLTGCHKALSVESGEEESSTVFTEMADTVPSSLPSEETTSSFQLVQERPKPEEATEATAFPQIIQQQTHNCEEQAGSETEATESVEKQPEADIPPATEAPQNTEIQETQRFEEPAAETEPQPTRNEPTSSFQPVTESELETTEGAEVTEESEEATEPTKPFDIGIWVSFAQRYAQSIGLNLDSAAVDCWDNPITAGAHCVYLERDICSRLDRYSRDDDITDVWIWAVSSAAGLFPL